MRVQRFRRRPPRLERVFQRYGSPVFFVTICTYRRQRWLACAPVHEAFIEFCHPADHQFKVAVGRYVIMPDHLHLFVTGGADFMLGRWVGMLKQRLTKAKRCSHGLVGRLFSENNELHTHSYRWQEGFFDHLLRSNESMDQKWDYIRENPVRAGLVSACDQWRYQGEITRIDRV
jgi:putative transposase